MRLALVGCGGMGRRHLQGYAALSRAGYARSELVACCDVRAESATALADEAEALLGRRPAVFTGLDSLLAADAIDAIDALDVVTEPSSHHRIAVPALEAGLHVFCEKPLGVSARACRLMLDAARRGGAVLATAENYRRGGQNRLARAVLEAGLLGDVHLMVQLMLGGDDAVMITPWRHVKESGSIALDMGVHLADIVEFLLGEVEVVYGRGIIAEPVRRDPGGGAPVRASGADSLLAQLRTAGGVEVQLAYLPSGPGQRYVQRTVHGTAGSMIVPADRSAGLVEVRRGDDVLQGEALRAEVGDRAALDEVTLALLGPDGTGGDAPFAEVDAAYLGVEIADFVSAVLDGRQPEVDGRAGTRAVALVLAVLESGRRGTQVRVADVLDGRVHAYQDEIDEALGLISPASAASPASPLAERSPAC